MSVVTESRPGLAAPSVLEGVKARAAAVLMTVWNAIIRVQEARARHFIAMAKKGVYYW